jgi:hypothetical protein
MRCSPRFGAHEKFGRLFPHLASCVNVGVGANRVGGDVCGRAFAAKGLIHLKTLRRFVVAHFALEKHLLLVTSWWLIAIWFFVFWIPLYSVLRN